MPNQTGQHDKAQRLQKLHRGPEILVIANAWDAAGARSTGAAPH